MTTPLSQHRTTVTTSTFENGTKQHTAHCTCGWEYINTGKPDVDWKARLHRATHNNPRR